MANFTAADVKALREQTGAGMMDVKKALTEADGDAEKALEIIRLKGLKSLSKREGRQASAGLLAAQTDGTVGVLVEATRRPTSSPRTRSLSTSRTRSWPPPSPLRLPTWTRCSPPPWARAPSRIAWTPSPPSSARSSRLAASCALRARTLTSTCTRRTPTCPRQVGVFVVTDAAGKAVAHDIAMHVAAYMPAYLDRDSVPADVLDKERATLEKITLEEGKPANIVPKIVEGRLNAFFKDNCLVDQAFARDPSKSVGQVLKEAGATVTNFVRVHVGA